MRSSPRNERRGRNAAFSFAGLVGSASVVLLASAPARADLNSIEFSNPIERAAARANQSVFDQLTSGANPTCPELTRGPTGACTGILFETFANVRELVHTANELTDSGPTTFSLNVDRESLGFALRWTAAEELAAQGSSATQFSTNQLNSLASRIAALRVGARGLRSASTTASRDGGLYASEVRALGGGASGDSASDSIVRKWSAFVDGSYGYGRKDDTSDPFNISGTQGAEDAFDFDGQEVSAGVDYRLRDNLVIGALVGYTDRAVDFDSSVSIVDGTIDSKGQSLMFYALWENDRFYLSGSLGAQWLEYDLVRRITYPSLNPLVPSVDVTTTSDTDSDAIIATLNGGLPFNFGGFGVEPFIKAEYQDLGIDGFTETGASGFEFNYGKQDIKSLDLAGGFKVQYAFLPSFGVIVPYLRGEYHKELENDSRNISALYAGLPVAGRTGTEDFSLATDEPDDEFMIAAAGFSVVLKNGLQGFLQYQQVFDLDTFDDRAITGGIRLEF